MSRHRHFDTNSLNSLDRSFSFLFIREYNFRRQRRTGLVTLDPASGNIGPMTVRYDMRRDDDGYTVFDIWTGWPALVKGAEQVGLDIEVADDLVDLLNLMNERRQTLP